MRKSLLTLAHQHFSSPQMKRRWGEQHLDVHVCRMGDNIVSNRDDMTVEAVSVGVDDGDCSIDLL